jgi:hypothetical protein
VFCFFSIDILLRIDAEPNYFYFHLWGCVAYTSGTSDEDPVVSQSPCGPLHLGSFLFLCDLVSTAVLLREMSFLGLQNVNGQGEVLIRLDDWGMPITVRNYELCDLC